MYYLIYHIIVSFCLMVSHHNNLIQYGYRHRKRYRTEGYSLVQADIPILLFYHTTL